MRRELRELSMPGEGVCFNGCGLAFVNAENGGREVKAQVRYPWTCRYLYLMETGAVRRVRPDLARHHHTITQPHYTTALHTGHAHHHDGIPFATS